MDEDGIARFVQEQNIGLVGIGAMTRMITKAYRMADAVRTAQAVDSLDYKPLGYRINILIARLCFRGIYFPQMGRFAWVKVFAQNRRTIFELVKEGFSAWRGVRLRSAHSL